MLLRRKEPTLPVTCCLFNLSLFCFSFFFHLSYNPIHTPIHLKTSIIKPSDYQFNHLQSNNQTPILSSCLTLGSSHQPIPLPTCADLYHRRKDFSDKAQEKLTPESQKSVTDKASESVTGAYDKAASAVQPGMPRLFPQYLANEAITDYIITEGDKTFGQNLSDTVGGTTKPGEKTYVQQAQDLASNAGTYVQDTANSKFYPTKIPLPSYYPIFANWGFLQTCSTRPPMPLRPTPNRAASTLVSDSDRMNRS